MNGSRQKYRLDDYLQDKAQRAASPIARGGSSGLRQGMAVTPTGNTSVGTVKPLPVRPPHTVQRPSGSSFNASKTGGGQDVTVETLKPDAGGGAGGGVPTRSQMTTAYTKQLLENALAMLADWPNRKFKYDAHSSPLYSIVQKQAEENARLASGRAYAQAKAATGGYGSSYATLAADEAGRQAMRELDDQQLALYEAARAEFEAENASMLDWYNTARQLNADAYALEQDAKANAPATMTLEDGTTVEVTDAARAAYEAYAGSYTGTNRETIKAAMMAGGVSAEDAEAAIGLMDSVVNAGYGDMAGQLARDPTLSGAVSLWQQVKGTEQEGAYAGQISEAATASITAAMDNMDTAYEALGVTPESWDEMFAGYDDPDERATAEKAYILDMAGEYRREGILTADDYTALYQRELDETMQAMRDGDGTAVLASQMAIALQNDLDKGNLTQNEYLRLMDHVAAGIDLDAAWDELGDSLVDKAVGKGADLISKLTRGHVQVPEWIQKTIGVLGELNLSVYTTAFGGGLGASLSGGLSKILGDVTVKQQIMKRMSMDADEYAAFKALLERKAALEEKTA